MHSRLNTIIHERRLGWRRLGLLVGSLLAGAEASAATVNFVQNALEDPSGTSIGAVVSNRWLDSGFTYSTVWAPNSWAGTAELRFTHWTVSVTSAASLRDAWGRSLNSVAVLLLENTTATAHYLSTSRDTDFDGIADWFEIEYFGILSRSGTTDFDGDGRSDLAEYSADSNPLLPNHTQEGGAAYAQSGLITCNFAGFSNYRILSNPPGLVDETRTVTPGTVVQTPYLSTPNFAYWTLDGVRQQDAWGTALDSLSFTVGEADRTVVAFILAGDSDADGLPDAWEQRYLATLGSGGASDSDGDGHTLLEEFAAGTHPRLPNTHQEGGVSYADSANVTVNFDAFSRYSLTSNPTGLVAIEGTVAPGTKITSPSITDPTFAQWTLDGEREQDAWGVALPQITFTVGNLDRVGLATFLAGDTDLDGLPDAWEQFYLGGLAANANNDTDGDGRSLIDEYALGTSPQLGNHTQEGGVSYADSASVVVNLQYHDRLRYALVEGILSELFSADPHVVTGWTFGPHAVPAAGDWDGDGRTDIFVVSDNALWVLQNIGGSATPSYKIATSAAFGDLAALCDGVERPMLALGDWNGDGRDDLVLGGTTNLVRGFAAAGNFHSGQSVVVAFTLDTGSPRSIPALGDLNADGRLDLLICLADGSVSAYLNNGNPLAPFSGAPVVNWLAEPVPNATGLACADITGDGVGDIVVADASGRIWEFHHVGAAYVLRSKVWAGSGAGFADDLTLALTDLNGDGHIDVLGGTAQGALIGLRDPRLGKPADLDLKRGGHSITLSWESNQQSRIRGYFVYRRAGVETGFSRLTSEPVPLNHYLDEDLAQGINYQYQITSVAVTYLPGNSAPILMESPHSATVSQTLGRTEVKIRPTLEIGRRRLRVRFTLESTREISGGGMEFRLHYNSAILTPLSQAVIGQATMSKSGLAQNLVLTDNGKTATGELHIQSTAGDLSPGQGLFMEATFVVSASAPTDAAHALALTSASLRDSLGSALTVDSPAVEPTTLGALIVLGDLTGDEAIDEADADRLGDLLTAKDPAPTPAELEAGDLNGDGKLDQGDLIMLRRELAGKKNTS